LILGPQLHCHFLNLGSIIVAELLESGTHWCNYFSWDTHLKKLSGLPPLLLILDWQEVVVPMIRCLAIKAEYQFHAWDLDQSYHMLHDLESYYLTYHVCCECGVCACYCSGH
jgi:hypothetical protein